VVAAAIGNAIFDATGARIREVPFTPQRIKGARREAPSTKLTQTTIAVSVPANSLFQAS